MRATLKREVSDRWLLLLLVVCSFALRMIGIDCGLPHHCEPDVLLVPQAAWLDRPPEQTELNVLWVGNTFYPELLARWIQLLPGASFPHPPALDAGLEAHLAAMAGPFLKARIAIAALSVLSIPASYWIARRFVPNAWAWFAPLAVATSLLATNYAQQARPHAALAGLLALAVASVLRLEDQRRWRDYALAGLACGLSTATLHSGACSILALSIATLLDPRRRWSGWALAMAIAIPISLLSYAPLLSVGLSAGEQGGFSLGGQDINWALFNGGGFLDIARYLWGYEPVLCVLAALSVATWRWRPSRTAWTVAAAFVPFFVVFGLRSVAEARFFVPIVTLLAVMASVACAHGAQRLPRWIAVCAPLLLLPGAYVSARLVCLRAQGEGLEHAAQWLQTHADRERDVIGVQPTFALPLFQRRESLERMNPRFLSAWERYQLTLPGEPPGAYDLRCIAREEWWRSSPAAEVARFAQEEGLSLALGVLPTGKARGHNQVLAGLRSVGDPLWSWESMPAGQEHISCSAWELGYHAFERVWCAERWGHPVEILRVR